MESRREQGLLFRILVWLQLLRRHQWYTDQASSTVNECSNDYSGGHHGSTANSAQQCDLGLYKVRYRARWRLLRCKLTQIMTHSAIKTNGKMQKFAGRNGITSAQLYSWNSVLGSDGVGCSDKFWAGYNYCVGTKG
jgi:hypothetical protein